MKSMGAVQDVYTYRTRSNLKERKLRMSHLNREYGVHKLLALSVQITPAKTTSFGTHSIVIRAIGEPSTQM